MFEEDYNEILTVADLCERLQIGRNAAYRLINSGEIKCFRFKRVWKIPRKSVDEYIEKQRTNYFTSA